MTSARPIPVFDGHNDVLLRVHRRGGEQAIAGFLEGDKKGQLDLAKARAGHFAGGLFAIFVPSPERKSAGGGRAPSSEPVPDPSAVPEPPAVDMAEAQRTVFAMVSLLYRLEQESLGRVRVCRNVADIENCMHDEALAAVLHMEGAEAIDPGLAILDVLHAAGLRSLGPVWSRPNAFGHGVPFRCPSSPDTGPGLTDLGKGLIEACNRSRILVDLSHLNERGFWDVAERSNAPLVATHSNAHAICPHARNLTDKQLEAVGRTGGLVGVNFAVSFLRPDGAHDRNTPLELIVAHIEHMLERVGEDGVGFGSDFDGAPMPLELGNAAGLPTLVDKLRGRGFSERLIEKLCFRNWLRVLRRTWDDSRGLKARTAVRDVLGQQDGAPAMASKTVHPERGMKDLSYPDLHAHIAALERRGLLIRVQRPINKDTEMHPLVRWQFRGGIPEAERKAFLFENVVDSKGRRYDIPVAVGILASNREIYSIGIGCKVEDIKKNWDYAEQHQIEPKLIDNPPCQEIVIEGAALRESGNGVDALPIPISTPGFDNAPYASCSMFITKDPETGRQNIGNYRAMVKSPIRLGMNPEIELNQGIHEHFLKYKARGEKMPALLMLGAPPAVTFASVHKLPKHLDELAVAGGLVGAPIRVCKARTVDLIVPAEAEIVIEGYIDTEWLEPEGSFGESHGYMNLKEYNAFMDVTAITRRQDAMLVSIISQVTPSESSLIKRVAYEPAFLHHLRHHLNISGVTRLFMHEPLTNLRKLIVIQMKAETLEAEVWRALYGASSYSSSVGKITIAVNEDIDPENLDMVMWALSYRMRPHQDLRILDHKDMGHGPRAGADDNHYEATDSAMLINAMLKRPYPPISLPAREYMENAKKIWEELGLPPLTPQAPWFGYSLGQWPEEFKLEAQRAVHGDYWTTGEIIKQRRRNDKRLNDPYLSL